MKELKFTEILKLNRELRGYQNSKPYEIAVISNIVMTQLKDVLELSLRKEGINANVVSGDYDSIVQDSNRFSAHNAVLVFWEAGNLVEGLHNNIYLMSPEEIQALSTRVEAELDLVLRNLKSVPLVIINRFSSLQFDTNPLRDSPLRTLCTSLNEALFKLVQPNLIIVDIDAILCEVGINASIDQRQYQSSKALYSFEFFKSYAQAIKPAFMAATGHIKKVLVLDCDNTLWSGVLGEDGELGIQMSDTTNKGKAFREVQTIICGLQKEGVLIALCSKNNLSDVDSVIQNHPDMLLRENIFVKKIINWNDKATNLRRLANELNLGLDSFVFVDDSDFEIGLIQKELPQVKCVQVPQNPSEYPLLMRKLRNEFFALSISSEDKSKTEMYRQDLMRKEDANKFDSIEDYLKSLELRISVLWDMNIPVSRAAQMTQKTNQFNLTTRRYTESDILNMLNSQEYIMAVLSLSDRYGDYGVTGMSIIKLRQDAIGSAIIDSFLMSCRIIGRNVEYRFFDAIARKLAKEGIKQLHAEYLATTKNNQVNEFYDKLGFVLIDENEIRKEYRIDLDEYKQSSFSYIYCD